jgi:hypothetical protein
LGLQSLNSFVLTNLDLIETPEMQEFISKNLQRYDNVIQAQIFLQDQGVSFSYTDSISYYEREDLIRNYIEFIQLKNEKQREAMNK